MHLFESSAVPDADVVLRTSDDVRLGAYRLILSEASPFFKDLFSLPQGNVDATAVPVIEVSETSEVMGGIMQLIYPGLDPPISSLDELTPLLEAAMKYEMVRAMGTLRHLLVSQRFVEKEPTRVYAIACRHDLEEEARIASAHTLRTNVLDCPLSEDLKYITAWSYHRLLDLHRKRSYAALVAMDEALVGVDDVKCMQCSASHYGTLCPPRWWTEFSRRAKDELRVRPTTDVIFSMGFLAKSAETGCQRCPGSVLESHAFLETLKRRIDGLPSTI